MTKIQLRSLLLSLGELLTDYFKDEYNQEIIYNEDGFIMYSIKNGECFVSDFYTSPSARGSIAAKRLFSEVLHIAKKNNCECITATVNVNPERGKEKAHHATRMIRCYAMVGFDICDTINKSIILRMNLQGGN